MEIFETIDGKLPLEGDPSINTVIRGQEVRAREFKKSKILENKQNEVTLEQRGAGTVLRELKVVKDTESQPEGTEEVWKGKMTVAGKETAVIAYRMKS